MVTLSLFTLGRFRVARDDETIPDDAWSTQKTKSLFKILVTHRGHAVTKEQLIEWLWQDLAPDSAGRELRGAVWLLRRALEPDLPRGSQSNFVLTTDAGYAFNPDAACWSDAEEFQTRCAEFETETKAEQIDRALEIAEHARSLYQGDYLEEDRYADWSAARREQLREMYFSLLLGTAELYARQRRYQPAIDLCQRVLAADRVRESVWRALMLYHYHAGDLGQALHTFEECKKVLAEELDAEPLPETRALYDRVRNREITRQVQPIPTNLPAHTPPTPFIGRDDERSEIARRLKEPACRLVTVTGAGGMGKSRLALQIGADLLAQYRDGVFFVPLAPVSEPAFILTAIANALNISFYGQEEPRVQLLNYLRSKHMLLLLDNFEHLLEAAPLVSDILTSASEMKILVTARKPLNLQAEWIFDAAGLDYPRVETIEPSENFSAVQLFLQSARKARASFSPSKEETHHIVHICQLLEGMPLGVELAAAWVRTLSCPQIAQQITQNLDFLSVAWTDVPERHRSMRAVFDHSLRLLAEHDVKVFERLCVFRGGFTFEAAEAVTSDLLSVTSKNLTADSARLTKPRDHRLLITDILSRLVDTSLLRWDRAGHYDLHELLRQYLETRLDETLDEKEKLCDAHAAFFANFLQQREAPLSSPQQLEVLDEIATEMGNVRAAWQWAVERKQTKWISQCLQCLTLYYYYRSRFEEGATLFEQTLEQLRAAGAASDPILIARLSARAGRMHSRLSHFTKARELLEPSLSTFRAQNIQSEIGFCLFSLGAIDHLQSQFRKSREQLLQALQFSQASGDTVSMVMEFNVLGLAIADIADAAESKECHEQALALSKKLGDPFLIATSLSYLAFAVFGLGEYGEAKQLCEQSLGAYREIRNPWGIAFVLGNLGFVALALGEYGAAKGFYRESIAIRREIGERWGMGAMLSYLGPVLTAEGDYATARQLLHEALAMGEEAGDSHHSTLAIQGLGEIELALANYPLAQELFQKALALNEKLGNERGTIRVWNFLGMLHSALGENAAAKKYFYDSLLHSVKIKFIASGLDDLLGIATLLAKEHEPARALELARVVAHHSASTRASQLRAEHLASEIEPTLPASIVTAARERARTSKFEEVAQAFLEEKREWADPPNPP